MAFKSGNHVEKAKVKRSQGPTKTRIFNSRYTPRDVIILQNETKMKACLDKNLQISLPKAYQNKDKSKTLVVKGVPTEFTNDEFKQVLDRNKIKHAKAERMKSTRDGRILQIVNFN